MGLHEQQGGVALRAGDPVVLDRVACRGLRVAEQPHGTEGIVVEHQAVEGRAARPVGLEADVELPDRAVLDPHIVVSVGDPDTDAGARVR